MVANDGVPTAIYTGFVDPEYTPVMLARAQDQDLLVWQKSLDNPILQAPPEGVNRTDFRDPYVWRENGTWKMVVGAGLARGEGAVLLYESKDLLNWHQLGPLFAARTLDTIQMWECPNFFPLADKYVLLVSLFPGILGVYYYVGEYDRRTFTPEKEGFLTESSFFYAPQVRKLNDDRTVLFGWLLEGWEDEALEEAGWAGVQSLPRELGLDEELRLTSRPVEETQSLRGECTQISAMELAEGERRRLPVAGRHLELEMSLDPTGEALCLDLLAAPDGVEKTSLRLNPCEGKLELDLRESSRSVQVKRPCLTVKLPEKKAEMMTLRVFLDGSVIEVFVNDQIALTGRAYPEDDQANGLVLSSWGGRVKIQKLKIWKMKAIWPTSGEI